MGWYKETHTHKHTHTHTHTLTLSLVYKEHQNVRCWFNLFCSQFSGPSRLISQVIMPYDNVSSVFPPWVQEYIFSAIPSSGRPSSATLPGFAERMPTLHTCFSSPTSINSVYHILRHLAKEPTSLFLPPSKIIQHNVCFFTMCPSERDITIKPTSFQIILALARCSMSGK